MAAGRHVEQAVLLDYLEGRVDEETAVRVREHLDGGCARCIKASNLWSRTLGALRAGAVAALPEPLVQQAVSLFDSSPLAQPRPSALQRIFATLVFDSRAQPALAGVRDGSSGSFQWLVRAGDEEIDLLLEPGARGWSLTGQALWEEEPGESWTVAVAGAGEERAAELDARGEFRVEGISAGTVQVSLRSAGREIVLPELRLDE
jgi:hypothetical protein